MTATPIKKAPTVVTVKVTIELPSDLIRRARRRAAAMSVDSMEKTGTQVHLTDVLKYALEAYLGPKGGK